MYDNLIFNKVKKYISLIKLIRIIHNSVQFSSKGIGDGKIILKWYRKSFQNVKRHNDVFKAMRRL